MIEIKLASDIVRKVIVDGKDYVDAVDEVFPEERKIFKSSNISVLLARKTISHYFLFENILHEFSVTLNSNNKSLLYVILANIHYVKVISKNTCVSFLKGEIPYDEYRKIEPVLLRKEPLEELISFEPDSDFYYATKYNSPIWLVHMWRKQFGDDLTKDFLEANINTNLQSYAVNTLKTTTDKLLLKYPEFSSPFDEMLLFNGTTRYQLTPEFKNDEYIDVKIGFKALIDEYFNPHYEVLLYSGYDDDFVKAAIVKTNKTQSLNLAVPNLEKRAKIMRFIRVNDIHNVNLFELRDKYSLQAAVSYKQDLVVVFPHCTRFDIVSKYPDFLLHFDRNDIDGRIAHEKETLELCSEYVADGGELLYIVNTLNKKESTLLIEEFLKNHPEFELDKEEQMVSSHPFATTMYHAHLFKRG